MDDEFTGTEAGRDGQEAGMAPVNSAQDPLQQLGGSNIKWVLETVNYDLVQASMVLSVPVNDLRRWMEKFDPSGTRS
jgi:hypothetical protein